MPGPAKCPRCQTPIQATMPAGGFIICPGCGARLRAKAPLAPSPKPAAAPPPPAPSAEDSTLTLHRRPLSELPPLPTEAAPPPPSAPLVPAVTEPGRETPSPKALESPSEVAPSVPSQAAHAADEHEPKETPAPGRQEPEQTREAPAASGPPPSAASPEALSPAQAHSAPRSLGASASAPAPPAPEFPTDASAEVLLRHLVLEVRALRSDHARLTDAVLHLIHGHAAPEPSPAHAADASGDILALPPEPTRARRRKSVLLVDDEEISRALAVQVLERAEIPVRAVTSTDDALAALNESRPDVVVIEPEIGGDPTGAVLIATVRAERQWAHIPVVLYTRGPVKSQQSAREVHGADEVVLKGPRGGEALVSQVITLFRRS
jgi:CheY-like chemotaxis protein